MSNKKSFEDVLLELESIINKLDEGEVSLEESVDLYKNGMTLVNSCNEKLDKIEKEIKIIKDNNNQ